MSYLPWPLSLNEAPSPIKYNLSITATETLEISNTIQIKSLPGARQSMIMVRRAQTVLLRRTQQSQCNVLFTRCYLSNNRIENTPGNELIRNVPYPSYLYQLIHTLIYSSHFSSSFLVVGQFWAPEISVQLIMNPIVSLITWPSKTTKY